MSALTRLVVASTFAVFPARDGGQRRLGDVCRALAERGFEIRIVALVPFGTPGGRSQPYPRIVEERVVTSKAQQRRYGAVSKRLGVVVDDVLASETPRLTPAYVERLRENVRDADIVIASRPYLLSAIDAVWDGPVVYDAMDDEAALKASIVPATDGGAAIARNAAAREGRALRRAALTFTISEELVASIAARFPDLPGPVLVVPPFPDDAPVPVESLAARRAKRIARFGERPVVLFVGSSHPPNVRAARELLAAAARAPALHFVLAGNVASELDARTLPPNVTLTGIVSDAELQALLALADVAVNPVRMTGGVNTKMLDYLTAGVPIVSTRVGVTGFAPEVVAHIAVDDGDDWAAAATALLAEGDDAITARTAAARAALARFGGADRIDMLAQRLTAIATDARDRPRAVRGPAVARVLRVGVDAWNLPHDRRGIGRYLRALLTALRDEHADTIALTLLIPEWSVWTAGARYQRELPGDAIPVASRRAARGTRFDLLWFPFNGPSWDDFRGPSVATLHDASNFVLPGFDDASRATFLRAAGRCEGLVTDSEFSRAELARELAISPERLRVVTPGVTPIGAPTAVTLDIAAFGPFALFVGETDERKGIDTLLAAARVLADRGVDLACVVVGRIVGTLPAVAGVRIHALGHVDDATLAALYRACTVFVYPSRYEGFGLPVLEAMAAGAPVVASDGSSIPEAGGDAALYARPGDASAFAGAIERIVRDETLATSLRARGRARAASMTWSRCADELVAVFRATAGG